METENSLKYFFKDFTRTNYRNILRKAKGKFNFKFFEEFNGEPGVVLWRHDVDYSLQAAAKLAKIENEEGVKSTYFLLPHSDLYNLLEAENRDAVKKILQLGHHIGLHFDCSFYSINNEKSLSEYLAFEKGIIEKIFETEVKVFSFHNPFSFELGCKKDEYGGMINTYADRFFSKTGYCSDSNGYWRYKRLDDFLLNNDFESLQILTHPEWWQEEEMSPKQRVWRCIDGRAEKNKMNYNEFLRVNGRENIDW